MEDVHSVRLAVEGALFEVTERAKPSGEYEFGWVRVRTAPPVSAAAPAFASAPQQSCNSADRRPRPGWLPGGDGSAT